MMLPELVLGCAFESYLGAKESARAINDFIRDEAVDENGVRWTLTHSIKAVSQWLDEFAEHNSRYHRFRGHLDWDVHPEYLALTEEHLSAVSFDSKSNEQKILEARRMGIIDKLPTITAAEIKDKSKEDGVVKAVAMLKALMLGVGLAQRAAQGRPSSQLEIMATWASSVSRFK
ncbi:hypothetical protein B0T14DRAFT_566070 [Immersiella caudata]|uniref:Uncharacterized protein n=1 Tax=Immersiella caudata TaxID=314043 RepID=A0AA39WPG5_9PEZI|nr:hypothetical protein B0T14DRAFT_566070 [Immersiella caudata]